MMQIPVLINASFLHLLILINIKKNEYLFAHFDF